MARISLREPELAKMQPKWQAVLKQMNESDLHHLRAALVPQPHFDLLGLPTEIRQMIFSYLLQSSNGYVRLIEPPHQNYYNLAGKALFSTSKVIKSEAETVLAIHKAYKFKLSRKMDLSKDTHGLGYFRRLELQVDWDEWADSRIDLSCNTPIKRAVNRVISEVQRNPYLSVNGPGLSMTVLLESTYWSSYSGASHARNLYDSDARSWKPSIVVWSSWAVRMEFMWRLRSMFIEKQINIDIQNSSEARCPPAGLEMFYVDFDYIKFKDTQNKRMGFVRWELGDGIRMVGSFKARTKFIVQSRPYKKDTAVEDIRITAPRKPKNPSAQGTT